MRISSISNQYMNRDPACWKTHQFHTEVSLNVLSCQVASKNWQTTACQRPCFGRHWSNDNRMNRFQAARLGDKKRKNGEVFVLGMELLLASKVTPADLYKRAVYSHVRSASLSSQSTWSTENRERQREREGERERDREGEGESSRDREREREMEREGEFCLLISLESGITWNQHLYLCTRTCSDHTRTLRSDSQLWSSTFACYCGFAWESCIALSCGEVFCLYILKTELSTGLFLSRVVRSEALCKTTNPFLLGHDLNERISSLILSIRFQATQGLFLPLLSYLITKHILYWICGLSCALLCCCIYVKSNKHTAIMWIPGFPEPMPFVTWHKQ